MIRLFLLFQRLKLLTLFPLGEKIYALTGAVNLLDGITEVHAGFRDSGKVFNPAGETGLTPTAVALRNDRGRHVGWPGVRVLQLKRDRRARQRSSGVLR